MLEKGQEEDWFGSHFILTLAITAAVCLVALVIWEWFRKSPIIDVHLFKNPNFAAANLLMFMMGVMLFSTLVIIPEFLQTLLGYTAQLAGSVLSASGVVLLFMMPIVGRLTTKVPAKWLIATGWLALAVGLYLHGILAGPRYQFPGSHVASGLPGGWNRVPLRSYHHGGLHRYSGGER